MTPADATLPAAWEALLADAASARGHGLLVRRIAPHAVADLHVAVERPAGARVLLVRLPRQEAEAAAVDLGCAGIEVRLYQLGAGTHDDSGVGVRLADDAFADLFAPLAGDLVGHLAALPRAADAGPALVERLLRWRKLLERVGPDGLGHEAQRGLYGELRFLRDHLVPAVGASRAVDAWEGPSGADQDFQLGRVGVEAKTTLGRSPGQVAVSSERQLDTTGLDLLILHYLALDARPGAGENLPAAVDSIRATLARTPAARARFEERLVEAGFLEAHRYRYERTGYTVRSEAFFIVRDDFPRLTERDLPRGVGGVRYSISVAECARFAEPAANAMAAVRQGAGAAAASTSLTGSAQRVEATGG